MTVICDTMNVAQTCFGNGRDFFIHVQTPIFGAKASVFTSVDPSTDSRLSNRIEVKAGVFSFGHKIAKDRPAGTRTALLTHTERSAFNAR